MSMDTTVIGWPVKDLDTPALLADLDKLERNIAKTANIIKSAGVSWRPHTKGQKVPAIAHMEIAAGAIGITCAKLGEAEVMASSGINDILIANQVVGSQKATRLANLCRRAQVKVAVDSVENVMELNAAAREKGVRIPVLIEVDTGMARCGVQPGAPTLALARRIQDSPGLRFMGLMTWEGHSRRTKDLVERKGIIEQAVGLLISTAEMCRQAGLPVEIVSCGGTGTEEVSSRIPGVTEIQAGGIIWNDIQYSSLGIDREFALTVLSTVVSRPAPNRIITDSGFKTMSGNSAIPRPIGLDGVKSIGLSAEHGSIVLETPNDSIRVGDKLEWIVGYSDSTVFLHDELYGIRDGIVEVVWPILARGKLR